MFLMGAQCAKICFTLPMPWKLPRMRQSHFEHVRVSMETGMYTHARVSRQENTAGKIESRFSIFLVEILGSFLDEKPESLVHTLGILGKKALPAVFLLVLAE